MGRLVLVLVALGACSGGGGGGGGGDDGPPISRCGDGVVDSNEQCDDGNAIAGDGCTLCMIDSARTAKINATWQLQTAAGAMDSCPTGFDTAVVTAQPVDGSGAPNGSPTMAMFDCAAGTGTTAALPAVKYSAFVAITSHDGSQVFATSVASPVDLSDATDKPLDVAFLTDGGKFKLAWQLVKASDMSPVTCDDVDAMARVRVSVTNADTSVSSNTQFTCSAGSALTAAFVAGTYTVSTAVLDHLFSNQGNAPDLTGQVIVAPDGLTDLGTIVIPVAAL